MKEGSSPTVKRVFDQDGCRGPLQPLHPNGQTRTTTSTNSSLDTNYYYHPVSQTTTTSTSSTKDDGQQPTASLCFVSTSPSSFASVAEMLRDDTSNANPMTSTTPSSYCQAKENHHHDGNSTISSLYMTTTKTDDVSSSSLFLSYPSSFSSSSLCLLPTTHQTSSPASSTTTTTPSASSLPSVQVDDYYYYSRIPFLSSPHSSSVHLSSSPTIVRVHVYDLDATVSRAVNQVTRALHIGTGLFHAGVEVYGCEYFFGQTTDANASGISWNPPRLHPSHFFRETICMG